MMEVIGIIIAGALISVGLAVCIAFPVMIGICIWIVIRER